MTEYVTVKVPAKLVFLAVQSRAYLEGGYRTPTEFIVSATRRLIESKDPSR